MTFRTVQLFFIAGWMLSCAPEMLAQAGRMEITPVQTLTLSAQQFLTGSQEGKPALISGELRLPLTGNGRLPAVLLVHGSQGLRPNIDIWANQFNSMGIAVFILDTFTGRGIINTVEDQSQLHELAMMYDSFRALEWLGRHPRIDPNRIAIMGFSKGGLAAVYSGVARFNKLHGTPGLTFAAHIGIYAPCNTTFIDETVTTGKPLRLFHGASDDLVQPGPCRAYIERLRAAGRDASITEYADAWHTFDTPGPALADRKGPNRGACRTEEHADGLIYNSETGKPFSFEDPCVKQLGHRGYSPDAHAKSLRDVSTFLGGLFGLRQ